MSMDDVTFASAKIAPCSYSPTLSASADPQQKRVKFEAHGAAGSSGTASPKSSPLRRGRGLARTMSAASLLSSHAGSHNGPRIKVSGKRRIGFFGAAIPFLLSLSPSSLIATAFVVYTLFSLLFGILYYAIGEACYYLPPTGWSFQEALWLSVHTFSTVGYGSIYPTCAGGQLLVVLESFLSLIISSLIAGAIFFEVVRPRSRVRYSKNALVMCDGDTQKITFRMVRESSTVLRDVNLRVMARFVVTDEDGLQHTTRTELGLKSSYYNVLDQWQVYHEIDETSPLWAVRDRLGAALSGLEVSLIAFDVAYNQEVRRFHAYQHTDLVIGASFVGMVEGSVDAHSGVQTLDIRHDKLDLYQLHTDEQGQRKRSGLSRLFARSLRRVNVTLSGGGGPGRAHHLGGAAGSSPAPNAMLGALAALRKRPDAGT